jgi:N-acetylated-alpha-linked acidic dipeptidase
VDDSHGVVRGEGGAAAPLIENDLGSGSDYTVFLNFLGVPVADLNFDGPYGVYHSRYDDRYWMEHFGDPGYRYMTAMVEVWGRLALRLANADVHAYDVAASATTV